VLRLKLFQAFCFIMPAAAGLMTQASLVEAAAAECRAKPESSGPADSHWYYRIDRANQRRCWYLSSGDSRTRHTSSLRRRELIGRGTTEPELAQQSEPDENIVAGSTPRREAVALPTEQTDRELITPQLDSLKSDELVPHKVTSISFVQPRAEARRLERGANLGLVILCGALATALLVSGGALQIVGRLHRRPRMATAAKPGRSSFLKKKRSELSMPSSKSFEMMDTKLNKLRERVRRSNIPAPSHREAVLRNRQYN
jgi:hypothetical protein